ncbi:winged helix-turn-helix domain-containing protein [Pseudoalteromonas sp. T1lg65]|uniref:winged helix-turn-helix domain-containing protein n=1 Tax=Pseudoalteromonas sp. T1lg65 TaxID=2077101 RepID=UPI003F7AE104
MKEVNFSRAVKEVKFAAWTLDPKKQTISDGDSERELEPLLYRVLCYLLLNTDQIVTRQDLVDDVWCQHYVDDNAINRAMSELRKVLKSEKYKGVIIKTHYRKGYSLAVDHQVVLHDTQSESVVKNEQPDIPVKDKVINKMRFVALFTIAVVAFIIATVSWYLLSENPVYTPEKYTFTDYKKSILTVEKANFQSLAVHPEGNVFAYTVFEEDKESIVVRSLLGSEIYRFSFPDSLLTPLGFASAGKDLFYKKLDNSDNCHIFRRDYVAGTDEVIDLPCDEYMNRLIEIEGRYFVYEKSGYRGRQQILAIYVYDQLREVEYRISSPNMTSYGDELLHYDIESKRVYFSRIQGGYTDIFYTDIEGSFQTLVTRTPDALFSFRKIAQFLYWFDYKKQALVKFDESKKRVVEVVEKKTEGIYRSIDALTDSVFIALDGDGKTYSGIVSDSNIYFHNNDFIIDVTESALTGHYITLSGQAHIERFDLTWYDSQGEIAQQASFPNRGYQVESSPSGTHIYVRKNKSIDIYSHTAELIKSVSFDNKVLSISAIDERHLAVVLKDDTQNYAVILDQIDETQQLLPINDVVWFGCMNLEVCFVKDTLSQLSKYNLISGQFEGEKLPIEYTFAKPSYRHGSLIYSDLKAIYKIDPTTMTKELVHHHDGRELFLNVKQVSKAQHFIAVFARAKNNSVFLLRKNEL